MNERIFELAKQSDLIQWDTLPSGAKTPDYESVVKAKKFAELIVLECAQVARNHTLQKYPGMEEYDGVVFVEQAIRKHFGVEQ
jgi:hypothetical protein